MLNYEEADDGIFWMNFEDFKDCFKRVQICKYVDDYSFDSIRFDAPASEKSCLMITMNVTERGHQTVSLSQKDHRFYPDDTNIKYSNCRVIVARKGDEGLEYVGQSVGTKDRDTHVECGELEEGQYLILVSIDWRPETPENDKFFNITSYG